MKSINNVIETAKDAGNDTIMNLKGRAQDTEDALLEAAASAKGRMATAMHNLFSSGETFKADSLAIANDVQRRAKKTGQEQWSELSDAAELAQTKLASYKFSPEVASQALNVARAAAAKTAQKLLTADGRKAIKSGISTTQKFGKVMLVDPRTRVALVALATIGLGYAIVKAVRNRQDEAAEIARTAGSERVAARKKLAASRRASAKKIKDEKRAARATARSSRASANDIESAAE